MSRLYLLEMHVNHSPWQPMRTFESLPKARAERRRMAKAAPKFRWRIVRIDTDEMEIGLVDD